jgi:transcriptional regulator with GAF, ATPase, and Fis domain
VSEPAVTKQGTLQSARIAVEPTHALRLRCVRGQCAGTTIVVDQREFSLGRADTNSAVLPDDTVSANHADLRTVDMGTGVHWVLRDLRSTNGSCVIRAGERVQIGELPDRQFVLADGDLIEFGTGPRAVALQVDATPTEHAAVRRSTHTAVILAQPVVGGATGEYEATPDSTSESGHGGERAQVFAMRRISDLAAAASASVEQDQSRLPALYAAQKQIGIASDLNEVLIAVCDAALALVLQATHVTIVIKGTDEEPGAKSTATAFVPVMTRVRGAEQPTGPIPVTRSVFRKVLSERAIVLAADAANEMAQSESLLGARIQSTLGVPLWRGEEIVGVLQLDNRDTPTLFAQADLDVMGVLAHNASLAVANARLLQRLRIAEDRLRKENNFLKSREQERRTGRSSSTGNASNNPIIIGNSTAMAKLLAQLDKVVDTKVTVLVEGETGAGKELVAASVHYRSKRRDKLFVGQNCAAMPENLLESELFGHKKGSFTGATDEKKGLFEIADGGTLFLDEVTEMPLSLQSKLLRALQEGEIRPVGATTEKKVDVRIVAATNRNLEKEVAEGRFREDLYYRLKVFPLRVPALRERREDIPLLVSYFVQRYSVEMSKPIAGFTQQAMELLQAYAFPGNVRELQNEIQRLMIQVDAGAFVTPDLLSPRVRQVDGMIEKSRSTKGTLKEMVDQVERWILIESLREHGNNKTVAAKTLGITREGLHKKLRQYGL